MPKYGYLQAIPMSFYSRDLYRDVLQNWKAGVFSYLLLVLIVPCLIASVVVQQKIKASYTSHANLYFPQIPEIELINVQLKTQENRPYLITDNNKEVIAIIDTSRKYQNLDNSSASLLVTKTEILYKDKTIKPYKFPSNTIDHSPAQIKSGLDIFLNSAWILFFPPMLLFSFIFLLLKYALIAVLGKLFVAITRKQLTYSESFKLTIFAATPSLFLDAALNLFFIDIRISHIVIVSLVYFIITMGYLIFAIRANKPN